MLHHQRDDDDRHRAGCAGDHPGPATEQGGQCADDECAVEAHQRIQVRDQREGDALGHQGEGGGESCQDVGAYGTCFHELPKARSGSAGLLAKKG
ncbi:hypothetical protein D3C72_1970230 [compost metagenome]